MGELRLRNSVPVKEDVAQRAIVASPRRRRKRRQTSAAMILQDIFLLALPLIFLLCFIATINNFTSAPLFGLDDWAKLETFAPPFPPNGSPEFQEKCPWISLS